MDQEKVDKIYRKYARLVKNYIYVITQNENLAEDIMQETFVVAIKQIHKFRGDCEISVWLRSIAKKILYKETQKHNPKKTVSIDDITVESSQNVEKDFENLNHVLEIYKSLQKLDPQTREVAYLRLTGNFTFKEIGEILGKSENWARVTFFRAKQKLNKEKMKWEN